MLKRIISSIFESSLLQFPVVTVIGPRQSGKTTLIKMYGSHLPYYNLEDLRTRQFATEDPYGFMAQMPNGGM